MTLVGLGQHTTVANGSIGREESNMRSNYKEVDKATSIILTTSEKGDAYLDTLTDEQVERVSPSGFDDVLLLCQTEYVVMPNPCTFSEVLHTVRVAVEEYSEEEVQVARGYTAIGDLQKALVGGYLAFKKVIWD